MRIDSSNGGIINSKNVYLHDDILNSLLFDRVKGEVSISISKVSHIQNKIEYSIKFGNVLAFEMTACDFWGKSPHILDFEYVEGTHQKLLPALKCKINKNQFEPRCKLSFDKTYIETVMTFTSGDTLTIVCEYIVLNDI